MTNENYTIQVLAVVNGKNTKGTLTLSLDKYEFNGTQQPINWEKASCTKGTTKVGQEFLDKFFAFAKEHKSKKAVSALAPFVSASVGGKLNAKKEYKNDLEEFCYKNYEEHEFERIMQRAGLNEKMFKESGIRYSDRDEEVSEFVLKCAILPYIGQLTENPKNIGSYKTSYSTFSILENSDKIASKFEISSFEAFIDKISKKANGYHTRRFQMLRY